MNCSKILISVALASLLVFQGCGGGGGSSNTVSNDFTEEISSDPATNIEHYNNAAVNFEDSLSTLLSANEELIGIASNNFSQTVDSYEMSTTDIENYNEKALEVIPKMATVVLYGNYLNELSQTIPSDMINTSQPLYAKPRFISFVTVALIAGIVWTAKGAYDGIVEAVNDGHKVAEETIAKATSTELEKINKELGISKASTAAQALKKYQSLSSAKKTSIGKAVVTINSVDGDDTSIIKARKTVANSATKLGSVAVKTTVGLSVTATGGQGIDKITTAVGASENAAAAIDLTVSIAGKQPLDQLTIAVESKETTNQTVSAPKLSESEAKAVLKEAQKGNAKDMQKVGDALTTIMNKVARTLPNAKVNADGSVTAPMAKQAHIQTVAKSNDGDTIKVPEMGESNAIVLAKDKVPEVIKDLDLSVVAGIALQAEDIVAVSESMRISATKISSDDDSITYKVTANLTGIKKSTAISISLSNASTTSSTKTLNSDGSVSWNVTVLDKDATVTITRLDSGANESIALEGVGMTFAGAYDELVLINEQYTCHDSGGSGISTDDDSNEFWPYGLVGTSLIDIPDEDGYTRKIMGYFSKDRVDVTISRVNTDGVGGYQLIYNGMLASGSIGGHIYGMFGAGAYDIPCHGSYTAHFASLSELQDWKKACESDPDSVNGDFCKSLVATINSKQNN